MRHLKFCFLLLLLCFHVNAIPWNGLSKETVSDISESDHAIRKRANENHPYDNTSSQPSGDQETAAVEEASIEEGGETDAVGQVDDNNESSNEDDGEGNNSSKEEPVLLGNEDEGEGNNSGKEEPVLLGNEDQGADNNSSNVEKTDETANENPETSYNSSTEEPNVPVNDGSTNGYEATTVEEPVQEPGDDDSEETEQLNANEVVESQPAYPYTTETPPGESPNSEPETVNVEQDSPYKVDDEVELLPSPGNDDAPVKPEQAYTTEPPAYDEENDKEVTTTTTEDPYPRSKPKKVFQGIRDAAEAYRASLTNVLHTMVEDTSGRNALLVCLLQRSRFIMTKADQDLSESYPHWVKIGTTQEEEHCKQEVNASLQAYQAQVDKALNDLNKVENLENGDLLEIPNNAIRHIKEGLKDASELLIGEGHHKAY